MTHWYLSVEKQVATTKMYRSGDCTYVYGWQNQCSSSGWCCDESTDSSQSDVSSNTRFWQVCRCKLFCFSIAIHKIYTESVDILLDGKISQKWRCTKVNANMAQSNTNILQSSHSFWSIFDMTSLWRTNTDSQKRGFFWSHSSWLQ